MDENDQLVLIDSGLSLRIPYCDACNANGVADVSEGTRRRLMKPQGQCGKLKYLAPEMFDQKPFDGHATDLWAAAITLFITLVGLAPFEMAQSSDKRFQKIAEDGQLEDFLQSLDVSLSAEAVDLLQNMLWSDPRDRLTLADVLAHPWVLGQLLPVKAPVTTTMATVQEVEEAAEDVEFTTSAPVIDRGDCSIKTKTEDPATVPTGQGKKHGRKLSGARDLMGKLRLIMPTKKIGCGSHQSVSSIEKQSNWKTPFRAGKV